jgi:hypothetical protein
VTIETTPGPPQKDTLDWSGLSGSLLEYVSLPLVYLAAPYSQPNPTENVHRVLGVADELLSERVVVPFVPHLTHLWDRHSPRPLSEWYAYDLAMLVRCDAIFRLPGESFGADQEAAFAARHNLSVFTSKLELYRWADLKFGSST